MNDFEIDDLDNKGQAVNDVFDDSRPQDGYGGGI